MRRRFFAEWRELRRWGKLSLSVQTFVNSNEKEESHFMVAGHLQVKKGYYYVVLSWYTADKKRKWL